ncbi:hypothetical protein EMIT0373P_20756 [Pseudomonas chlororaphis]
MRLRPTRKLRAKRVSPIRTDSISLTHKGNPSLNSDSVVWYFLNESVERPGHSGTGFYDLCPVRRGRQYHLPAYRRLAVRT